MSGKLTGTQLKWLAIIMMAIDHVGAVIVGGFVFFRGTVVNPDLEHVYWLMRNIGRLAFPIFCFLLVEGFFHTRSRKNYMIRLFLFALVSEFSFDLAFGDSYIDMEYQNVFFVLFIGFAVIWIMENLKGSPVRQTLVVLAGCALSEIIMCDYGLIGVVLIVIFYVFRQDKAKRVVVGALWLYFGTALHFAVELGPWIVLYGNKWEVASYLSDSGLTELPGVLAFVLIGMYNGEKGKPFPKYFFYAFYPVHLLILGLLRILLFGW